jgi:hypothetical protein
MRNAVVRANVAVVKPNLSVTVMGIARGTVMMTIGSNGACHSPHGSEPDSGRIGAKLGTVRWLSGAAIERERSNARGAVSFFCRQLAAAGQRLFLRVCETQTGSLLSFATKYA